MYKLNVDGAISASKGSIGTGAIVRNWKGEVMLAVAEEFFITPSPENTEAMAILRGLTVAKEAGFTSLILEGDAKNILKDLCSRDDLLSDYGHILDDDRMVIQ